MKNKSNVYYIIHSNRKQFMHTVPYLPILLIFVLLYSSNALFFVDINNPFALTQTNLNITTLDADSLDGDFLVGFQDGQARRYSSDFSTYTSLYAPQIVDQYSTWQFMESTIFSNGLMFLMYGTMTVSLSNNYTTVRAFTFYGHSLFQTYSLTQTILDYRGIPISLSSLTPCHIVVFNRTIKALYKGTTTTVFNLTQTFGSSAYCTAVVFLQNSIVTSGDFIFTTYTYYEGITGVGFVQINITLTFQYNFTTKSYDMSTGSAYQIKSNFLYFISKLMTINNIILIQIQNGSLLLHCNGVTGDTLYQDANILANPIQKFIYNAATYYILHSSGLVAVSFNFTAAKFQGSNLIVTLPNNTYRYTIGSLLNVLYIPYTPYIYKTDCQNQTYTNEVGSCTAYICIVANCVRCQLTSSTCGICALGYIRNDNLTCSLAPIPANNTADVTNSTNNTNITPNTTNNTNNTTTSNHTNSILFNDSLRQPTSIFYGVFPIFFDLPELQFLFWLIINATKTVISIPSMRKLSPMFYYFGNFDDLYLYMFHDRLYGDIINEMFTQINDIEVQKWNMLNYDQELGLLRINNQSFYAEIDYQNAYLTYKYSTPDHPSEESQGLIYNCINFFVIVLPVVTIGFILLKGLFRMLFNFSISRLFRKFDLFAYLMILLFDGNVQQFAFYLTAELKYIFFFSYGDKFLKSGIVWFCFMMIIVAFCCYLISFGSYGNVNKLLIDNNRNNFKGNVCILLQFGIRNLILGVFHSILRTLPYFTMLSILIFTQFAFFALFAISVSLNTYLSMKCIWFYLLITFIRILLISTFYMDFQSQSDPIVEMVQCMLIVIMIIVYFLATFLAIFSSITQLFSNILKIIKGRPQMNDNFQPKKTKTKQKSIFIDHIQTKDKRLPTPSSPSRQITILKRTSKLKVVSVNSKQLRIVEIKSQVDKQIPLKSIQ